MKLTDKEAALLNSIAKGMDTPGEGWLHELADESRSTAGVLGSLVKKGFAQSSEENEPGMETCYWVEITETGKQALNETKPQRFYTVTVLETTSHILTSFGFKHGGPATDVFYKLSRLFNEDDSETVVLQSIQTVTEEEYNKNEGFLS